MLSIPFNCKQFGNFSNYNISTDGGLLLLDKIQSKLSIVKDVRNPVFITLMSKKEKKFLNSVGTLLFSLPESNNI